VFNNSTSLTVAATTPSSSGSYSFTIKNPDGGQVTSASNAVQVFNGNPSC
jgi:hypothetical protein